MEKSREQNSKAEYSFEKRPNLPSLNPPSNILDEYPLMKEDKEDLLITDVVTLSEIIDIIRKVKRKILFEKGTSLNEEFNQDLTALSNLEEEIDKKFMEFDEIFGRLKKKLEEAVDLKYSRKIVNVFLSHNKERDGEFVKKISLKLMSYGILPWLDEFELLPGSDIYSDIESAIKFSHAFAIFISKDSIREKSWVETELQKAIEIENKRKKFIIPIFLGKIDELVNSEQIPAHWFDDHYKRLNKLGIESTIISDENEEIVARLISHTIIHRQKLKKEKCINVVVNTFDHDYQGSKFDFVKDNLQVFPDYTTIIFQSSVWESTVKNIKEEYLRKKFYTRFKNEVRNILLLHKKYQINLFCKFDRYAALAFGKILSELNSCISLFCYDFEEEVYIYSSSENNPGLYPPDKVNEKVKIEIIDGTTKTKDAFLYLGSEIHSQEAKKNGEKKLFKIFTYLFYNQNIPYINKNDVEKVPYEINKLVEDLVSTITFLNNEYEIQTIWLYSDFKYSTLSIIGNIFPNYFTFRLNYMHFDPKNHDYFEIPMT